MRQSQGRTLGAVIEALDGLRLLAVSPNPSGVSLTLAVEAADLPDAIERLHGLVGREVTSYELKVTRT
jgi:hypothetical protein